MSSQLGITHLDRGVGMTAFTAGILIMIGSLAFTAREIQRISE
jgi:hypothetical protein